MKDSRRVAETQSGEPHGMRYEKYKQTGLPWLPEVPEVWEYTIVSRCFDIQLGKMLCSSQLSDEYTLEPYYCAANVHFDGIQNMDLKEMWFDPLEKERYCVENGDLLVVEGGAGAGGSAIVKQQTCCTYMQNSILRLRARGSVSNMYLCYWLESIVRRGYIEMSCNKATIPHFTKSKISQVPIPFPPLPEQHTIVAYLDDKCGKIDELVAAKEKEVELLKELKQTVIADAVTGKGRMGNGEWIMENGKRRMRPSGIPWLPEVPEGWEVKRLGAYFTDDVVANKDFKYNRAFKFNYGRLIPKNEIGEPEEYRDVYVKYSVLKEGDIVFNGLNLNYDFISQRVAESPSEGIITSAYVVCRPRPGVEVRFFTYLFKTMDFKKMFHGMGTGIRLTLSFGELKKQMLPVPPLDEQRAIVAYIEEKTAKIDQAVAELTQQVAALKEYKQRLIADVVTGQMRVA